MDRKAVLAYLDDYVRDPRIIEYVELPEREKQSLPLSWQHILSAQGPERVQRTIAQWEKLRPDFDEVPDYFKEHLLDIELIHHDEMYTLLYEVREAQSKKSVYYEARNPNTKQMPAAIAPVWSQFPANFQRFYDFHDGWYHLSSQALGPSPMQFIFPLSDEEWGILDDIGPQPIDLNNTFGFFRNGAGAYLCVELKDGKMHTLLWSAKEAPTYNLDFWPILDSWMVIALDA